MSNATTENSASARDIITELLQCAEVGRYDGKLTALARDWLASSQPTYTPQQMAANFRAGQNTERMQKAEQAGEVQGDARAQFEAVAKRLNISLATWGGEWKYISTINAYQMFQEGWQAALAARQPVGEPADAIERIARLLYLRSCNRRADGGPMHEWEPMDEHLKDYYRKDAQNYETLRKTALWPAGLENYTITSEQVIR